MPRGESTYTIPGTYSWVCPTGVTSVSVVCVGAGGTAPSTNQYSSGGGGALAWANNITVTPGTTYSIVVGDVTPNSVGASGSSSAFGRIAGGGARGAEYFGGAGGTPSGTVGTSQGGGNGGQGGSENQTGGGGAGGYSGDGGMGGSNAGSSGGGPANGGNGAGGAGGGGGSGGGSGGGGGVGLFGQGSNGVGQIAGSSTLATGGSGGSSTTGGTGKNTTYGGLWSQNGGLYGGGGAKNNNSYNFPGGTGAVRIIWPGNTRSFPSTDVSTP